MKKLLLGIAIVAVTALQTNVAKGQGMAINKTGSPANASAMLDVNDTAKGLLIPRMTQVQRNAIASPATGLMIFQTDATAGFYYWNGAAWTAIGSGGGSGTVTSVSTGNLNPLFTATVNTPTTTPAIAYTLNQSASFTVFTNSTNALGVPTYAKVVPQALFATSGTASSTTFYRGDGQWQTPAAPAYGTIRSVALGTTLASTDATVYAVGDGGVSAITLPLSTIEPKGYTINIIDRSSSSNSILIQRQGGDVIVQPDHAASVTSLTFTYYLTVVSDGAGTWYAINDF
jgi:hypothetical protein